MMKKNKYKNNQISTVSNMVVNGIFIMYSTICVAPIILIIAISISSEQSIMDSGFGFIPEEISFEAYKFLLRDIGHITRAYGLSVFVTIAGTLLSVTFTTLYAYPISRRDFPLKKFFTFFIFFTMLFNGGLIASYLINTQFYHFKNSVLALIIPLMMMPFNVLIVRTFFVQSVPRDLIDAGKIDGASEYAIFFRIVLPLAKPAIASIALFDTLFYWNDWFSSLLYINDKTLYTLQFTMYTALMDVRYLLQHANQSTDLSGQIAQLPNQTARFAMVLIAIGPIILAYPYFQKYFVKGIAIGAIKG